MQVTWDALGSRIYQTGVDRGMLYVGTDIAVPWNGLINVTEASDGEDSREFFVDGEKVLNLPPQEDFAAKVEAYSAPIEFAPCAGRLQLSPGLYAADQPKKLFGFSYRTLVGNDVSPNLAYKIHVVYNALAQISDFSHQTTSDNPSVGTYSWDITTTPETIDGYRPTAHVVIDTRFISSALLIQIENTLYGDATHAPRLPDILHLFALQQGSGVEIHKMSILGRNYISGTAEIFMKKMVLAGGANRVNGTGSVRMHKMSPAGSGTAIGLSSSRRVGAALGFGTLGDQVASDFLAVVGGSRYKISHFFYGSSIPASLAAASKDLPLEPAAGRRACIDFELTHYGIGGSPAAGAVTDKNNLVTFVTSCIAGGLDLSICLWHEPYNKFNIQATQALNNLDYTNSMSYYGAALRALGVKVVFDPSNYSANHHWNTTIGNAAAPGLGWAACALHLIDEIYTDWYPNEGNSGTTPAGSGIQGTWDNVTDLADAFNLPVGIMELGPAPATNSVNWNDADIQAFLQLVTDSLAARAAVGGKIADIIFWATNDNATTTGMYLSSGWSSGTIAKYQHLFDIYNGTSGAINAGSGSVAMKKMKLAGSASISANYRTVVLSDSPSVYYRLGDASAPAVPDASAGGVNAAMNGTVTFGVTGGIVGDSNKAASFPGTVSNDLATAATPGSAYDLGDGPFSIEFLYKAAVINTQMDPICKSTAAYIVRMSSANHWAIVLSGTGNVFSTSNTFTDTSGWHHVVVTRVAGAQPHIYIDGVDQAGVYTPGTFANNTIAFRIGEGGVSSSPWNGLLDEVALYKTVLSQARVTAHFQATGL